MGTMSAREALAENEQPETTTHKGTTMLGTILLIILILILVGALPTWGHSRSWGYGPSGLTFVLLIILIVLLATGRI